MFLKIISLPILCLFCFGVCYCLPWSPDWCEQLKILQLALCKEEEDLLQS